MIGIPKINLRGVLVLCCVIVCADIVRCIGVVGGAKSYLDLVKGQLRVKIIEYHLELDMYERILVRLKLALPSPRRLVREVIFIREILWCALLLSDLQTGVLEAQCRGDDDRLIDLKEDVLRGIVVLPTKTHFPDVQELLLIDVSEKVPALGFADGHGSPQLLPVLVEPECEVSLIC